MSASLAKGFAYLTSASFIGTLTQVVKGKLMAVFLGASGVGIYSQLTHLFNLMFTLGGLGFRNGIIKKISQSHSEGDEQAVAQHYASVFIFLSLFSIAVSLLLVFFAKPVSHYLFADEGAKAHFVILVMFAVPFAVMANFYRALLSGYMAVKLIVKAQVIVDVFSLLPFFILLYFGEIKGAVAAFVLYQFLKLLGNSYYFYKQHNISFLPNPKLFAWQDIKLNVKFGASGLLLVSFNILLMIFISRYIIAELGEQANGFFSVAFKVATVYLGAVYANASSYYFPLLAKSEDAKTLRDNVNHTCRFYLYLLPPVIVVIMTGGEWIVQLLFSKEFLPAALLLLFFLPGDLLRISAETFGLPLLAKEKFLAYNSCYFIWAATYALMALFAIESFGIVGVGIAYLASQLVNCIVVMLVVAWQLQVWPSKSFVVTFLLAAMLIACSAFSHYLANDFFAVIGMNVFILLLWLAASFNQAEFRGYIQPQLKRFLK